MKRRTRGFVLALVLVLLVAAALLAVEALSGAAVEQALASAARGQQRAFEAAEFGLARAESGVHAGGSPPPQESRTLTDHSRVQIDIELMAVDPLPAGFSLGRVVARRFRATSEAAEPGGARLTLAAGFTRLEPAP
jgi:hypothetical protein